MSTFDAGKIQATGDIDRTPFSEALRKMRAEADAFERKPIKLRVDLDSSSVTSAEARIAKMRAQLGRNIQSKVDIDTSVTNRKVDETTAKIANIGTTAKKASADAAASLQPLVSAIAVLGPALVPAASGLLGLASSAVGYGTTALLAFKGVNAEVKSGTALGVQYSGMLGNLKANLSTLERTAAGGVLAGFSSITSKLERQMPSLNQFIRQSSLQLGDLASHGVGALLGIFRALEPTMLIAEKQVDKFAIRFEQWATGPGGAQFFHQLGADIPMVVSLLGNVAGVLSHVVQAAYPLGTSVLSALVNITGVLRAIPVPILTALITGFAVWRVASIAQIGVNLALAAANQKLAVSEVEVAVATRGAMAAQRASIGVAGASTIASGAAGTAAVAASSSRLVGVLGGIGRAVPWIIGAAIGVNVLDKATKNWANSNNAAARTVHYVAQGLDDLFHGHPFSIFGAISQNELAQQHKQQDQKAINEYFQVIDATINDQIHYLAWASPKMAAAYAKTIRAQQDAINAPGTKYATANFTGLQGSVNTLNRSAASPTTGASFDALTASIQKNIDAEAKWQDASGKTVKIQGLGARSVAVWDQAMTQANGNIGKAISILQGHAVALADDQAAIEKAAAQQQIWNTYLSNAQSGLHLTATQTTAFTAALGLTVGQVTASNRSLMLSGDVLGMVAEKFKNGDTAMQGWLAAISQVDLTSTDLTQRVNILGAALTALRGVTLDQASSNLSAVDATEKMSSAINTNRASIGANGELLGQLVKTAHGYVVTQPQLTAGALAASQAMQQGATSAVNLAQSIYANTGSVDLAIQAYTGLRSQFVSTMVQAGMTQKQADGLAKSIYGIPQDRATWVRLLGKKDVAGAIADLTTQLGNFGKIIKTALVRLSGVDLANNQINGLLNGLNAVSGTHTAVVQITTSGSVGPLDIYGLGGGKVPNPGKPPGGARGFASAPEGWFAVNEAGPEIMHKQGNQLTVLSNSQSKRLVAQTGMQFPGFASGYIPPSLITGGTSSTTAASHAATAATRATTAANRSLVTAISSLLKQMGNTFGNLASLAKASPSQVNTGVHAILNEAVAAQKLGGANSQLVLKLRAETTALQKTINDRAAVVNQLAKVHAHLAAVNANIATEKGNVATTIMGGFDIGTSGSGYASGIESTLDQQLADAKKFEALRAKAKGLGLNATLLRQITEEGPQVAGKNLEAIVNAGKTYVQHLNADYGELSATANRVGAAQAQDIYGKQQAADIAAIHKLTARQIADNRAANADIHAIAKNMATLERDLTIARRKAGG